MNITYYSPRKVGPESALEDFLTSEVDSAFPETEFCQWIGGAISIGGSFPDVVIASYRPELSLLQEPITGSQFILAYLHSVKRARFETIQARTGIAATELRRSIEKLVNSGILKSNNYSYEICPEWRNILPRIIAIETKVSKWRIAFSQADNNSLFAHSSYIALPEKLAAKVANEAFVADSRIGVISVSDTNVRILKSAKFKEPILRAYYYELAIAIAVSEV